jgi:hypothetical protein
MTMMTIPKLPTGVAADAETFVHLRIVFPVELCGDMHEWCEQHHFRTVRQGPLQPHQTGYQPGMQFWILEKQLTTDELLVSPKDGRVMKRDGWTNQEVIDIIEGHIVSDKSTYAQEHNEGVSVCAEAFYDFTRPLEEFGAMGYDPENKQIVHIGALPPFEPNEPDL